MARDRWTTWPHIANRISMGLWIGPTNSLAHHAVFSADAAAGPTTYTFNSSANFRGFVGSAGLTFNPLEVTRTFASTGEFRGFVGSAGLAFNENYARTFASTGEFRGFVGSAGLSFNENYVRTFPSTGEFAGFVGSAGLAFNENYSRTFASTGEFASFVGSGGVQFIPFSDSNSVFTSGELAGFTGFATTAYVPFAEVQQKRRRIGGYIVASVAPLPPPTVYTAPLPTGGFAHMGGAATAFLKRQPLNYAALAIAGVLN
jgi:hypothetical protein